MRRVHTELLVQVTKDRAREQVQAEIDFTQDNDLWELPKGLVDVKLPGGQTATEIDKPIGGAKIYYIAVSEVVGSAGINLRLGGSTNDPILVKPPVDTANNKGIFLLTTETTSLHVDNPSATAEVSAQILIVCHTS